MKRLANVMLAGTGSDVGKSIITAGLCRIFMQDGYHPAPFKAQNMALNSYATPDGKEIGRAQAVQAEAAGIPCSTDMNPLLLKPSGEHTSQVVLNGRPIGNRNAYDYFRKEGREELRAEVNAAFDRLASKYNPIVLEGAGSIAEINLRDSDLVNMPMARHADADVILVGDIDRGGVFASVYGSIMLQTPEDRKRIKGIIINKFRGDLRLFESGRKMLEDICGVPVLGVVPYLRDIHIEEEDSVALSQKKKSSSASLINVAVLKLPHISNFTDFNRLEREPGVNLFYTEDVEELTDAQIIIIPGSKSTISDLIFLRETGLDKAVKNHADSGKTVMGICGGYQIMGKTIADPDGIEGTPATVEGLGLLPVATVLTGEKVTRRIRFRFNGSEEMCEGYEIHMGRTAVDEDAKPLNTLEDGNSDGCITRNGCMGSYIHGILDNDTVIRFLLGDDSCSSSVKHESSSEYKERQYDMLADELRKHIDIDLLYSILTRND